MSSWMPGDPLVSKLVQHPVVFAAVAVVSCAAALAILPRVSALWRSARVRLGLSNGLNDKVFTFMSQHAKNMQEAERNPSYAFSVIACPALLAGAHRVAVGILPDDSLLADIKRSDLCVPWLPAVCFCNIMQVQARRRRCKAPGRAICGGAVRARHGVRLHVRARLMCSRSPPCPSSSPRPCCSSASGQQKHFKSFAGGCKARSIHPCDDYCAVPLQVLHRAADQLCVAPDPCWVLVTRCQGTATSKMVSLCKGAGCRNQTVCVFCLLTRLIVQVRALQERQGEVSLRRVRVFDEAPGDL
jgi:hypothetical protein